MNKEQYWITRKFWFSFCMRNHSLIFFLRTFSLRKRRQSRQYLKEEKVKKKSAHFTTKIKNWNQFYLSIDKFFNYYCHCPYLIDSRDKATATSILIFFLRSYLQDKASPLTITQIASSLFFLSFSVKWWHNTKKVKGIWYRSWEEHE